MTLVFINYRRHDEAYAAALLDEKLSATFGADRIFRASRSILPGEDFELSILRAVEQCRTMLVLIGPHWTTALNDRAPEGIRSSDWVRREVVEAFKREVLVVPVLLANAARLSEADLPADMARLARLQYLRFDYRSFSQDSAHIAHQLRTIVPELT